MPAIEIQGFPFLMCKRSYLALAILVLLASSLARAQSEDTQPQFQSAHQRAQELSRLQSLLISHEGELIFEEYYNGTDPRRPANMKSASKSVISALVGLAIQERYIESVREPIANYFPEYMAGLEDSGKRSITIEDLLTMRSGLETTSNRNYGRWVLSEDWVAFALNQPLVAAPGTRMLYSTGSTHLLSAIITRATGMDTKTYAERALTAPLGYSMSYWSQDPQGIYFGGNDMEMTPRQMLRFGELYLNNGRYDGEQILAPQWIQVSHEPHARSPRGQGRYYGYGWWLRDLADMQIPTAWGYGGQLIFVVSELDLVVVATSDSDPSPQRRSHLRALYDLVEEEILWPAKLNRQRADMVTGQGASLATD
jgi:CubicO group peptidase (beta-lactamase class C family)